MTYNNNLVTISVLAGVGGDDAKDFTKMLLRMYDRYADRKNWKKNLINENTLEIRGENIYEILKQESGVHRLVRISPFDAKKLRHTSFALVEVLPELPESDASKLQIPEKDLKVEFTRSSGPGGQNVNKVETAVRLVHLPTGITSSSQIERSQAGNRDHALRLLKAKLAKLMEEKKEKELSQLKVQVKPDWAQEIRSYVLHPYKQIKDHETGIKISQIEKVLDGDLDILLEKIKK